MTVLIVLAAALLHASWNALTKSVHDRLGRVLRIG
ncbi:hypothetical protein EV651_11227 [Kribbella sp. VKM Ac-2571]|nr:hypothetical protein EV651_11227 [Kribbella sp. VKM Ac-2571]